MFMPAMYPTGRREGKARKLSAMLHLRDAAAADVPLILELIRELATYERDPSAVVATEANLLRDGFGKVPRFRALIAEWEGDREPDQADQGDGLRQSVGFAFFFFAYSTWTGGPVLYLEDLFVRPAHRQRGIGIALMKRLAQIAIDEGCKRFVWQVLDWNEPAIRFYESLGASVLKDWLTVRMDERAILQLAGAREAAGEGSAR
jgi:GNAT superfamily N-acetyltransferase